MSKKREYIIKNGIKYYNVGEVHNYFYAGGAKLIGREFCTDVLAKLEFLYGVWLGSDSIQYTNLPSDVLKEVNYVLLDLNEEDFWYQGLLEYEVLGKEVNSNCLYMSDSQIINNHARLDKLLERVIGVFNKVDSGVNNCESLVDFLLKARDR